MAYEVVVPPLGQTVDTVTLVSWYRVEGDAVREGEPLFVIETDKASLDVEAQASGILRRVAAQEGDEVAALSTIALIVAPGEEVPGGRWQVASDMNQDTRHSPLATRTPQRTFVSPRARRLAEAEGVSLHAITGTGPQGAIVERDVRADLARREKVLATPVAERLARQVGVDLSRVAGSGPRGRVTRRDVEVAMSPRSQVFDKNLASSTGMPAGVGRRPFQPRPDNEALVETPLQGVRALIAGRMAASVSTTARVTLTAEADATELAALRRQLAADGFAVSYNDLFLYTLGRALREHPDLNASLEDNVLRRWKRVHIGLAVDTERGLLVPVVRDVAEKRLAQLARETADLVERTRANKVLPEELQGGTFTLTNLGMVGIDVFTPIINLPEAAVLGVGRIVARPVVLDDEIAVRQMVWLSLAFDHRLVDGAPAARFLQRVVQLVEHPHLMHT